MSCGLRARIWFGTLRRLEAVWLPGFKTSSFYRAWKLVGVNGWKS